MSSQRFIIIQMQGISRAVCGKTCTYHLAEVLGEGQFGKVYRAHPSNDAESVAVKVIRKNKFLKNEKLKHLLESQMKVLSQFNHPNVIQLHELIAQKQDVCIVYEYCEGGTLEDIIPVPEEQITDIFWQMIAAMTLAQEKCIIHRDLKPANILFKNGQVKIADWGFSRFLERGETTCSFIGSPAYMAPQALKGGQYSQKADIWSLGIMLYQSLTGACPWKANNIASLTQQIKRSKVVFPKESNVSAFWRKNISEMLSIYPHQRPSCKQLKMKLANNSKIVRISDNIEQIEHEKIVSCVFFLQIVQWSRKNIIKPSELQLFIKLIEQNLLRLRSETKQRNELLHILQKQIKVVSSLKRKIQQKIVIKQKSLTHVSSSSSIRQKDESLNPEGVWEQLVKKTVKYVIDDLETIYKVKQASNKQERLINLNVLLDLIVFVDISNEYLQKTFQNYLMELGGYHKKILLKLINYKLQLINKQYYQ